MKGRTAGGPTLGAGIASGASQYVDPTQSPMQKYARVAESSWVQLGLLAKTMKDPEYTELSFRFALQHNPLNMRCLLELGDYHRSKEEFAKAIDYYKRLLNVDDRNGDVWACLGHCYLMTDQLNLSYEAYQRALSLLSNPGVRCVLSLSLFTSPVCAKGR